MALITVLEFDSAFGAEIVAEAFRSLLALTSEDWEDEEDAAAACAAYDADAICEWRLHVVRRLDPFGEPNPRWFEGWVSVSTPSSRRVVRHRVGTDEWLVDFGQGGSQRCAADLIRAIQRDRSR